MEGEDKTLAERRAEIRRRKILDRGSERIGKILGNTSSLSSSSSSSAAVTASTSAAATTTHPPSSPSSSPGQQHSPSSSLSHNTSLPGRDLAIDPTEQDLIAAAASHSLFSLSPDDILSDRLSNLNLNHNSAGGLAAQNPSPESSISVTPAGVKQQSWRLLSSCQSLYFPILMLFAAATGVIYGQSIIVSFLMMQPLVVIAGCCLDRLSAGTGSIRQSIRSMSLIRTTRTLFDHLLIFIFVSVMMIVIREGLYPHAAVG